MNLQQRTFLTTAINKQNLVAFTNQKISCARKFPFDWHASFHQFKQKQIPLKKNTQKKTTVSLLFFSGLRLPSAYSSNKLFHHYNCQPSIFVIDLRHPKENNSSVCISREQFPSHVNHKTLNSIRKDSRTPSLASFQFNALRIRQIGSVIWSRFALPCAFCQFGQTRNEG